MPTKARFFGVQACIISIVPDRHVVADEGRHRTGIDMNDRGILDVGEMRIEFRSPRTHAAMKPDPRVPISTS